MLKLIPNYADHAARRPTTAALALALAAAGLTLTLAAVVLFTPAAQADPPPTYGFQVNQYLPSTYGFRFPLVTAFNRDPSMPAPGPALPWGEINGPAGLDYQGEWLNEYRPNYGYEFPFGMQVHNGPNYPDPETTDYPSGIFIVKYSGMFCPDPSLIDIAPHLFETPLPPTFAEAKDKADEFCVNTCGAGFEMTDFDMTQWQYTCYIDAIVQKAYQVASWGGSKCEKTEDNGLIQACNPLTGMIAVRNHLREPASTYPEGDLDGDGVISLADLTRARNIAFGPKLQGLGESRMLVMAAIAEKPFHGGPPALAILDAEETMQRLDEVVIDDGFVKDGHIFEITHWEPGVPVDCDNEAQQLSYLTEFTEDSLAKPGKQLADDFCYGQSPGTMCANGAMVYGIGHCRVNSDGSHSIRLVGGNCMRCI